MSICRTSYRLCHARASLAKIVEKFDELSASDSDSSPGKNISGKKIQGDFTIIPLVAHILKTEFVKRINITFKKFVLAVALSSTVLIAALSYLWSWFNR